MSDDDKSILDQTKDLFDNPSGEFLDAIGEDIAKFTMQTSVDLFTGCIDKLIGESIPDDVIAEVGKVMAVAAGIAARAIVLQHEMDEARDLDEEADD